MVPAMVPPASGKYVPERLGMSPATSARNVGADDPPDVGPANTVLADWLVRLYESAGVVVAVATVVVKIGDKSPDEKLVTVPLPPEPGKSFAVNLRNVGTPDTPSGLAKTRFELWDMPANATWGQVVGVVTLAENSGGNPVDEKLVTVPNPLFVPPIPNHAKS